MTTPTAILYFNFYDWERLQECAIEQKHKIHCKKKKNTFLAHEYRAIVVSLCNDIVGEGIL